MRASGVLLPVFSLPGRYGIGSFSGEAYHFVDFLHRAGQQYWQILPLGPTSYGDSPYQSFSTFAGNPYFIDLDDLVLQGLLTEAECAAADCSSPAGIDYALLYQKRYPLLFTAFRRSRASEDPACQAFCRENAFWLSDYALFMAIKDSLGGIPCSQWPAELRLREETALEEARRQLQEQISFHSWLQYTFFRQWDRLKAYANGQGIRIIGDIPIYVSADSADLWASPELFQLTEDGKPSAVAGCPPDGFSADGQLWGNPLYRWEEHEAAGFAWWIRRITECSKRYDIIRIDHFRGFDEYFSIPAGDKTAAGGHWEAGPGMGLFTAIRQALPDVQIIAEDLGYVTDSVRQLVKDTGFPNMKVLEFAFDSRDSGTRADYLPYNYNKNCVVYTGTHDNETLLQWLDSILPEEKAGIEEYLGRQFPSRPDMADALIRLAQSCTADYCIIPIQDYLHLGAEARINKPSETGSWRWRLSEGQLTEDLEKQLRKYSTVYGRI